MITNYQRNPQEMEVPDFRGSSVLVVDDDPAATKLLCLFLGDSFSCTPVLSGSLALNCLFGHRFDAVISDLRMPGISGLELLRLVRDRFPYMAFLVTTGVEDLEVAIELMRSDADDYLVKPIQQSLVVASLQRALRRRWMERQLEAYRLSLEQIVADRTRELHLSMACLQTSYEETIRALGNAVDLRDGSTAGHSWRVCQYSLMIAGGAMLSDHELSNLARAAYLHDIGKLGIPDKILLKPSALTKAERKIMQQHAEIGFNLLKSIPFLAEAAEIVLSHHEQYDASGYPRGLRGDGIPLGARIFAVADTLDAITSDRVYRRASSFSDARDVIRAGAGSQFDPEIVKLFLDYPDSSWQSIANDRRHVPDVYSQFLDKDVVIGGVHATL